MTDSTSNQSNSGSLVNSVRRFNDSGDHLDNFAFPSILIQRHMKSFDDMMNKIFKDDLDLMTNFDTMTPFNMNVTFGDMNGFVEKDGKYLYEVDIPKEMINYVKISEKNRMIRISAKKETIKEGDNSKSTSLQSFHRSVQIPTHGVPDSAVAEYSHGKLLIIVEKE